MAKIGKSYIGISRDHSASMRPIVDRALKDYNSLVEVIKTEADKNNQDTVISVVECGTGSTEFVGVQLKNVPVNTVSPMARYIANGWGTPLWDSVGELITIFEKVPQQEASTFLVMIITDGLENASKKWNSRTIQEKMAQLQGTDRWTFVFRVPRGAKRTLMTMGIPEGNILEWDQTDKGFEQATVQATAGVASYLGNVSRGITSTQKFFTNISSSDAASIKAKLVNISDEVDFLTVQNNAPSTNGKWAIKDFVESMTGKSYKKGSAFYQLMKPEKVQDYKEIMVRNKKTKETYSGVQARNIIGLPQVGDIKVYPGNHGQWDIFVQSTSVNRVLPEGTALIYWDKAV